MVYKIGAIYVMIKYLFNIRVEVIWKPILMLKFQIEVTWEIDPVCGGQHETFVTVERASNLFGRMFKISPRHFSNLI